MTTIISPIYGTTGLANPIALHSHRLSVFYGILATGVVYDTHPAAALFQEQYHALARAALSLDPIWQEATSATVQALFVLMRYTYTVDRTSNEYRWLLGGLCTRVGQMVRAYFICHPVLAIDSALLRLDSVSYHLPRPLTTSLTNLCRAR